VAVWILATADAAMLHDFYAFDARSEQLHVWTLAFFVWDSIICVKDNYGILYILHGIAAMTVYLAGLKRGGFLHWMGPAVILFEASTPFLHMRKAYYGSIGWNPKLDKAKGLVKTDRVSEPPTGKKLSLAFGVSFILVRLVWGIPVSILYQYQSLQLILSGEAHSVPICIMVMVLNAGFCVLNVFWFSQMIGGVLSQDDDPPSSGGSASGTVAPSAEEINQPDAAS